MGRLKMELKLVINDTKTGKSYTKTMPDNHLVGKKIGEEVDGTVIGLPNYQLTITGGSDLAGFPMRRDVNTSTRKKILAPKSVGFRSVKRKGIRLRKTIHGNTVSEFIAQLNLKVKSEGSQKLEDIFPKKEPAAK
jgi:small subunit ribosomal protein S6e